MRIALILLFFLTVEATAQRFGGGAYGGISTSQVSGDDIGGFHKVGGWAGLFTDFRFTPRSTLQLELSFIQKGSKQTPTLKNGNTLYFHNQNMVEMPIMYRWYGIRNLSLEVGTQVGFFLNTVEKDISGEIPNTAPLRKAEWSLAGGLSYYFLKGKLEVNGRYSNSVISLKSTEWWVNHVIAFSVRYWFRTTLDQQKISSKEKKDKIKFLR